jgi:hypothetical protein
MARPGGVTFRRKVEATSGIEPLNRGFADLPLNHLGTSPRTRPVGNRLCALVELAAPRGFEPRLTDPKSAVLPLDEGAEGRTVGGQRPGQENGGSGAEDGTRTRDPHLGKVMLYQLSHFRSKNCASPLYGAESQDRTGDTAIFSRVLYRLSYLGPFTDGLTARRRGERYHARPKRCKAAGGLPSGPWRSWVRHHLSPIPAPSETAFPTDPWARRRSAAGAC